jgi:hypothetical protein
MYTSSGGYTNGIKYIGEDGWIFVSRGNYTASASDPVAAAASSKALDASDPAILKSVIGPNEIHLKRIKEQHEDWLQSIETRKDPISDVEKGHRACSICLITHISMKLGRKVYWNPNTERFSNDTAANAMLRRPQRYPYGVNNIKGI